MSGDDEDSATLHPLRVPALHGLEAAERALLDAFRSQRFHHAWLIGGPAGIGKATLAWHFARFVLAHADAGAASGSDTLAMPSDSAINNRILAGGHGDLVVLERQWNDKTKKVFGDIRVDDVRQALRIFQRASASGGYRICIIDSADDLNRSSANALLKLIEEPPPRSLFLIIAHKPGQVMPTLVSRTRRLHLPGLTPASIVAAVQALGGHWAGVDQARLEAAAARANGSVGEALRLLQEQVVDLDGAVSTLLAGLPSVDWARVHRLADSVGMSDDRFEIVLRAILDWLDRTVGEKARAGTSLRGLVRISDGWDAVRARAREAQILNLDKRPLLLSIFGDLARAARPA